MRNFTTLLLSALTLISTSLYAQHCHESALSNPLTGTICDDADPVKISDGFSVDNAEMDGEALTNQGEAIYFDPSLVGAGLTEYTAWLHHNWPASCSEPVEIEQVTYKVYVSSCSTSQQPGCTDETADNYADWAGVDNGSCIYSADEIVSVPTVLEVEGRISAEDVEGYVADWTLDGNTLTVDWVVLTPNEIFTLTIPYTVTATTGLVVVELEISLSQTSSVARMASATKTIKKGINLRITSLTSDEEGSIELYPLPAQNTLNIETNMAVEQISILNEAGQEVLTSGASSRVDISNLASGTYIMQVTTGNKQLVQKFVK